MNELNLQNPAFRGCLMDVQILSSGIYIILFRNYSATFFFPLALFSKNHILDNHQVWHYLDFSEQIETFQDLEPHPNFKKWQKL